LINVEWIQYFLAPKLYLGVYIVHLSKTLQPFLAPKLYLGVYIVHLSKTSQPQLNLYLFFPRSQIVFGSVYCTFIKNFTTSIKPLSIFSIVNIILLLVAPLPRSNAYITLNIIGYLT